MKTSSPLFRFCIVAVCVLSVAVTAQAQNSNRSLTPEPAKKSTQFSLLFGLTAFIPGEESFGGGLFGFAWTRNPKHLFSVEIGGGIGPSKKIGRYSYDIYRNDSFVKTMNDGEVTYDYSFVQAMFSWNRVFNPSGKWQFRVGPTAGLLFVYGGEDYSPTTYEGSKITGVPTSGTLENKYAFTAGVVAGGRWNISQSIFLDLNYTLAAHTPMRFEERNITVFGNSVPIAARDMGYLNHRINLMLGWNLKSRKN